MFSTVKELHVAIDEQLQGFYGNREEYLNPYQKDFLLNQCVLQYINDRLSSGSNSKATGRTLNAGFEENIKRYDELRELKRQIDLTVYPSIDVDVSRYGHCILPNDYFRYISSASRVHYKCNMIAHNDYAKAGVTYFSTFKIEDLDRYKSCKVSIFKGIAETVVSTHTFDTAIQGADGKFMLIDLLLNDFQGGTYVYAIGGKAYFYFEDLGIPDGVIATLYNRSVTKDYFFVLSDLEYDKVKIVFNDGEIDQYDFEFVAQPIAVVKVESDLSPSQLMAQTQINKNDLVSISFIEDCKDNYYYNKNRHKKPLCTILNRGLKIQFSDYFLVDKVQLEYIKQPLKINHVTGTLCELTNLEEVVSLAVQKLKAYIDSGNYEKIVRENLIMD